METTQQHMENTKQYWVTSTLVALCTFILCTGYLWIRRWGTPLDEILYKITFGGLAVSGTVMLASSYLLGPLARTFPNIFSRGLTMRKYFGMVGFGVIVVHLFWGLATLTPHYYPKLFIGEIFTGTGMIFLIAGTLGFFLFLLVALTSLKSIAQNMPEVAWRTMQRLGYLGLIIVLVHFTIIKYKGWVAISDWAHLPNSFPLLSSVSLPPLSFILFLFIVLILFIRLITIITNKQK